MNRSQTSFTDKNDEDIKNFFKKMSNNIENNLFKEPQLMKENQRSKSKDEEIDKNLAEMSKLSTIIT